MNTKQIAKEAFKAKQDVINTLASKSKIPFISGGRKDQMQMVEQQVDHFVDTELHKMDSEQTAHLSAAERIFKEEVSKKDFQKPAQEFEKGIKDVAKVYLDTIKEQFKKTNGRAPHVYEIREIVSLEKRQRNLLKMDKAETSKRPSKKKEQKIGYLRQRINTRSLR